MSAETCEAAHMADQLDRIPSGPAPFDRIVILGTSGSGKSTLAKVLVGELGSEYIDLDGEHHGPNWKPMPLEQFRDRVSNLADGPAWIFDGNYIDKVSDVLWHRADTIIWLNLSLAVILPRLIRRSVGRIVRRTELWGGNREGLGALFGRNSVIRWAVVSQRRHKRELPGRLQELRECGTSVIELRSPASVAAWTHRFQVQRRRGQDRASSKIPGSQQSGA